MNDLAEQSPEVLAALADSAKPFIQAALAGNSRRAYRADCAAWATWCGIRNLRAFPAAPEALSGYLAEMALEGARPSTISRRVAAISHAHRVLKLPPPVDEMVRATLRGIRSTIGTAPHPKAPLVVETLRKIVDAIEPDTLAGARDRALLLLGFSGAFRRSELAALRVCDLAQTLQGLLITIPRSKTDQEGKGQVVAIPRSTSPLYCPVRAVARWRVKSGINDGPLFRRFTHGIPTAQLSPYGVVIVLKRRAQAAGVDPAGLAGHSLRSGFLTSAAANGASIWKLMEVSRHRDLGSVRGYVRAVEAFRHHAGEGLL